METRVIARVNNVDIVSTSDEQLIPIRPICEALGVAYERQSTKLKEHPILSSTVTLRVMVAADGKNREMLCLPIQYVFGWLFTINPANVSEEARDALIAYQTECYDALYRHFFGAQKRQIEHNLVEIALLEQLSEYTQQREAANNGIRDTRRKLEKLREERLKEEPRLFG